MGRDGSLNIFPRGCQSLSPRCPTNAPSRQLSKEREEDNADVKHTDKQELSSLQYLQEMVAVLRRIWVHVPWPSAGCLPAGDVQK